MSTYMFDDRLQNFIGNKLKETITNLFTEESFNEFRTLVDDNEVSDERLMMDFCHRINEWEESLYWYIPEEIDEKYS